MNTVKRIITIGCFGLLMINVAYAATGVWRYGSQHIDAYGIWMLKAKAIHEERGIPFGFLRDPAYAYSHQTYPLLLPVLLSLGEWTLWLYPMAYVMILLLLYRIFRNENQSHLSSLAWTTAASFMGPLIAQGGRMHVGLADIWICLLVVLCMVFSQRKQWWGVVGAVMIASMVKTEGIFLIAFLFFTPGVNQWRFPNTPGVLRILIALTPFLVWQVMVRMWGLPSDVVFGWPGFGELFHRAMIVVVGVGKEMMNWRNWYVIWPLFWLNIFLYFPQFANQRARLPKGVRLRALFAGISEKQRREDNSLGKQPVSLKKGDKFGMTLIFMTLGYVAVYLFADMDTAGYVASSIDRIMLQLLPLWWIQICGNMTVKGKNNSYI